MQINGASALLDNFFTCFIYLEKICTLSMNFHRQRKGVAPVLATLLMIAVAVSMSVIIFMWSQGFLSQTSASAGSQQGVQNQAAQSSISIETVTFVTSQSTDTATSPKITLIVRNVGAVSIGLGSVTVQGISSNTGFKGSLTYAWTSTASTDVTETSCTWVIDASHDTSSEVQAAKGAAVVFSLTETTTTGDPCASGGTGDTRILSGDVLNIKVTTTVGTFGSQQFTIQ
jgi:flagellin-like protein